MSTKTTFKRVALVAVAALGLGVVTSVAPATAATTTTALTAGVSAPARVGVVGGATLITATSSATAGAETVTAQIVTAPATSTAAVLSFADFTGTGAVTTTASPSSTTATTAATGIASATYTSLTGLAEKFYVTLKADKEGTYQILVTADGSTTAGYSAGKVSTVYTITTSGAPTALTVSKVGAAVGNLTTAGAIVKVSMKDANGNATVLGLNEGLNITHSLTNSTTGTTLGATSFAPASDVAGVYSVTVIGKADTADGSDIVTFTGTGVLPTTLTSNITVSAFAATAIASNTGFTLTSATGYATGSDWTTAAKTSHSFTLTVSTAISATLDTVYPIKVAVTNGDTYATTLTVAATKLTGAVSVAQALGTTYTSVAVSLGTSTAKTIVYAAAAQDAVSVSSNNTAILSATKGVNTFTAKVVDQYANAIANAAVSVSVAGRNTVASRVLGVTDALGQINYTLTDAGTTGSTDTVTFTITSGTTQSASAVITYGTVTVDTVTVSGGSKAETVAGATLTAVNAADNGPETSAVAISAVVKDASGNLLAGVPVTFSVDKGLVKKTTAIDYATVYTGSNGKATSYVFNWVPGTQTITATAGGKTGTDYLTWGSAAASAARVLSISATGDIVTVKVVDRFGNPVKGVSVDLSRTGTGLFGNGSSTQIAVTDKNGTSDVRFSGTGTVVAELATATYDQSADVAGEISAVAATAAVAGTTKGTGATLAPAGVNKVSIAIEESANSTLAASQSAADAAAEATDAANAATDAANAAAEAADAATAAAQDAADAVAALSTQVSEMVNALKKQITALTNLVIKIQKKVKA